MKYSFRVTATHTDHNKRVTVTRSNASDKSKVLNRERNMNRPWLVDFKLEESDK